ncbi:hypothetical protein [Caulobacter sp. Root1472]|uniref:hypothetical protein n=1 Tax=Caulobacter sp. Root1472 TaxID=1736470 RepID=UPI0006F7F6E6|nr:hypothetical protein [Caulobacter sp. Root1472]KQZ31743.1 hypothetical protein ASD47_15845 [Caulobacter sp. Root1472]
MTFPEIDQIIDAMVAEAAETGDENQLPGAIFLHPDHYVGNILKTEMTTIGRGIRYRGVRILVSREFESRVVGRSDLTRDVGEFEAVTPAP